MKTFILTLILLNLTINTFSQDIREYDKLVNLGWEQYGQENYKASAEYYSEAFKANDWKATSFDRYNSACSWALCEAQDSALYQLEYIYENMNYSDFNHIKSDSDLNSLHETKRWNILLSKIKERKDLIEKDFNKELITTLEDMVKIDQEYRNLSSAYNRGELDTLEYSQDKIYIKMRETDSLNYFMLAEFVHEYGFLGYNIVGVEGSDNFWLLMQHQDRKPEFQREVLKLMKTEMENDNASKSSYAYLMDRVQVNADLFQVYGTQMMLNSQGTSYEVKDVIEPEKLNERRASVQLGSIEDYIKLMNDNYLPK